MSSGSLGSLGFRERYPTHYTSSDGAFLFAEGRGDSVCLDPSGSLDTKLSG